MGLVRTWLEGKTTEAEHGTEFLPPGVCPVIGRCAYDWHDALGDVTLRAEFVFDAGLDTLLETSKVDEAEEMRRKRILVCWLKRVAWPAWLAYAQLKPGDDLSDVFAEAVMENKGNGNERILSELRMSGVTPAALAAQGVRLGLTKDRRALRERAKVVYPKVEASFRDGSTALVSPFEYQKWCFQACFTQPANPVPVRELLQESMYCLLRVVLDPAWAPVDPIFADTFSAVQAVIAEADKA